jgi:hypothetical protein
MKRELNCAAEAPAAPGVFGWFAPVFNSHKIIIRNIDEEVEAGVDLGTFFVSRRSLGENEGMWVMLGDQSRLCRMLFGQAVFLFYQPSVT